MNKYVTKFTSLENELYIVFSLLVKFSFDRKLPARPVRNSGSPSNNDIVTNVPWDSNIWAIFIAMIPPQDSPIKDT